MTGMKAASVALVADRSAQVRSHQRIPHLVQALRADDGIALDVRWVGTDEVADARLDSYDGIWLLPGSPYRSEAGALLAARTARESGTALLATCGGFQHAMLEYARTVCGLTGLDHAENTPDASDFLVVPLACSLVGQEGAVTFTAGSSAARIVGAERTVERYHCSYGLNPAHVPALEAAGMRFTGHDDDGEVRAAELPSHPFYVATLFQPELAGDGSRCHPLVRAFAQAAAGVR